MKSKKAKKTHTVYSKYVQTVMMMVWVGKKKDTQAD